VSSEANHSVSRRSILKGIAAAGVASTVGPLPSTAAAPSRSTAIRDENAKTGTTDWQLTYTRVDPPTQYRCPWIEGYVSHASIRAGETLDLMVSTNPARPFKVDFYRMGYYGGTGGRHLLSLGQFEGKVQPDPPVGQERLRECTWEPCTSITIPKEWMSGVYLTLVTRAAR